MNQRPNSTNTKATRGRPKDPDKAERILCAAGHLFLTNGLRGTSMDAVAKEADVSKQTLYSHFAGKDDLYRAVITSKLTSYQLSDRQIVFTGDLEKDLNAIGYQVLCLKMDADVIAMFRSVIGEGHRYPKMAELFYASGPEAVTTKLTQYFEERGVEDARFYAVAFLNTLMGEWQMKALMGLEDPPTPGNTTTYIEKLCRRFMKMLPL